MSYNHLKDQYAHNFNLIKATFSVPGLNCTGSTRGSSQVVEEAAIINSELCQLKRGVYFVGSAHDYCIQHSVAPG